VLAASANQQGLSHGNSGRDGGEFSEERLLLLCDDATRIMRNRVQLKVWSGPVEDEKREMI
jgi:hypothetical protein